MRAAFLLADVLAAEPDAGAALRQLAEGGLTPVVIAPHAGEGERLDVPGVAHVHCPPGASGCWDARPELLLDAAAEAGVAVGEAFLVCHSAEDIARGAEAGCRPVLVLAGRRLDEVYGFEEPDHKEVAAAADLGTAIRYMREEAELERQLGPFAFAPHPVLDEVPRARTLSGRDIGTLFLTITVAGVAVALGVAYLLQEVYQHARLPNVAYWLTLQFIPQTLRGTLFILLGVGVGLMVPRLLTSMRARRGYR